MDVFSLRTEVINDYSDYVNSFVPLRDDRIQELVTDSIEAGHLWPEPLLQLSPAFEPGDSLGGRERASPAVPPDLLSQAHAPRKPRAAPTPPPPGRRSTGRAGVVARGDFGRPVGPRHLSRPAREIARLASMLFRLRVSANRTP
jgi:hypothetical protein